MSQHIKIFAAAYLAKAGCDPKTTALEVNRHTSTVRVVVAAGDEMAAAVAAAAFRSKYGWAVTVERVAAAIG